MYIITKKSSWVKIWMIARSFTFSFLMFNECLKLSMFRSFKKTVPLSGRKHQLIIVLKFPEIFSSQLDSYLRIELNYHFHCNLVQILPISPLIKASSSFHLVSFTECTLVTIITHLLCSLWIWRDYVLCISKKVDIVSMRYCCVSIYVKRFANRPDTFRYLQISQDG